MQDDRIQGILFSSSQKIDLSPRNQQNHFFEKLNGPKGKKNSLIADIIHPVRPLGSRLSRRAVREHAQKVNGIQKRLKIR